jgi:transposase-like protein
MRSLNATDPADLSRGCGRAVARGVASRRYANNRGESDHAQLKRWLRPMRGIKTMAGLRTLAAGHAFAQNLRRGHYEIAVDQPARTRLAAAFTQLARAI